MHKWSLNTILHKKYQDFLEERGEELIPDLRQEINKINCVSEQNRKD